MTGRATAVEPFEDGIAISATIMGAMPMKGVLRPSELRLAIDVPGVERILFAADYPYDDDAEALASLDGADLDDEQKQT